MSVHDSQGHTWHDLSVPPVRSPTEIMRIKCESDNEWTNTGLSFCFITQCSTFASPLLSSSVYVRDLTDTPNVLCGCPVVCFSHDLRQNGQLAGSHRLQHCGSLLLQKRLVCSQKMLLCWCIMWNWGQLLHFGFWFCILFVYFWQILEPFFGGIPI